LDETIPAILGCDKGKIVRFTAWRITGEKIRRPMSQIRGNGRPMVQRSYRMSEISWQIVPSVMSTFLADPDREESRTRHEGDDEHGETRHCRLAGRL
jgi:hypothetical protein